MMRRIHTAGFSTLELLVAVAIITMTTALVLINFTGVRERTAINRAARELALAARQTQNISLSVTRVDTSLGSQIALNAGLKLETATSSYILFVDINKNAKFDAGVDGRIGDRIQTSVRDKTLEGGVLIRRISYVDSSGVMRSVELAHMLSASPEATIRFTDASGASLGEALEIELAAPSGKLTKKVTIRTSGQISVK